MNHAKMRLVRISLDYNILLACKLNIQPYKLRLINLKDLVNINTH